MTMLQWCSGFVLTSCFIKGKDSCPDMIPLSCQASHFLQKSQCALPASSPRTETLSMSLRRVSGISVSFPIPLILVEELIGIRLHSGKSSPVFSGTSSQGCRPSHRYQSPASCSSGSPVFSFLPLVRPICWYRPLSWGHIILSCSGAIVYTLKNARFFLFIEKCSGIWMDSEEYRHIF